MRTDRRKFIHTMGAGAAGIGISSALPLTSCSGSGIDEGSTAAGAFVDRGQGKNWPLRSGLKSKRIKFDVPQNQISWAYMKELREHNKTRRIYDINPYVEVYQFRDNMFGLFTENCDGMGDVWMYLTVGPEKALLVDTAYGLGDVRGLVDQLTGGKEVVVVNTHDHYDHAYGNCHFEKVYCHQYLVSYLENQHAHMWDYLFDGFGNNIWLEFDRNDLPTFKKYEIVGVPDGYTFNLGGDHEVELVFTGGHAAGHAAYLDKKNRILFSGDNICSDVSGCGAVNTYRSSGPYAENTLLSVYRDNVKRLVDRMEEYDYIFPCHFMNNIENNLMPKILDACNAILDDPEGYDYKVETWGKDRSQGPSTRYYKFIKDFSVIAYNYSKA